MFRRLFWLWKNQVLLFGGLKSFAKSISLQKSIIMTTLEILKNSLIDKIVATKNEKLLHALINIFESTQPEETIQLSLEQIEMLMMSEDDIKYEKLISEDELRKIDLEWN